MMPRCPICGASSDRALGVHGDFPASELHACTVCRHHYCWPEPDADTLASYYEREYSSRRGRYFGLAYRNIMIRRARAQADYIAPWSPPGKCIDVGCGIGALVVELSRRGWKARGVDSDPSAVAFGRDELGAQVSTQPWSEVAAEVGPVDLLCLSHVVEHLGDIRHTLGDLVSGVRPGGLVFIEVPNSPGKPEGDMESHLHFFTRRSLTGLLSSMGLDVLSCHCCGPLAAPKETRRGGGVAAAIGDIYLRARRRLLGSTEWDGWYDRLHEGDEGLWIRCVASRAS